MSGEVAEMEWRRTETAEVCHYRGHLAAIVCGEEGAFHLELDGTDVLEDLSVLLAKDEAEAVARAKVMLARRLLELPPR
jgi:hypothetical protein